MKGGSKKLQILELRKQSKSYNQIAGLLGVSKSTIAYHCKGINWSRDIKKQLTKKVQPDHTLRLLKIIQAAKLKWARIYESAEKEAVNEFSLLKNNPLFISGLMIYWGEGDKVFKNGQVKVGNTDPRMLSIFNKFLREICKANPDKIKGAVLLYPDLDAQACLKFWSENVKIPLDNFIKPSTILGRHKTKRLQYGVCIVGHSNKYLKRKILKWIDLFSEQFQPAGVVQK